MNNKYGKYQHYKTHHLYEIIGFARHTETQEEMVIYRAINASTVFDEGEIWVRPKEIFFQTVNDNGIDIPRFKRIE